MNDPIKNAFIIGTGRCGTSWLGQMLNSHAEICVPPEIQLLFEYSDNGSRLFEEFSLAGSLGLGGDRIASIIEQGCPHKLELFFDYREFCRRKDTPKNSMADFVTALYSAIARSHGKSWLIEQTPWYGSRLDLLSHFFPKAKIIHVVRDGRDVALSFARTRWWHTSPRLNLARWQREIKKITLDAALYLDTSSYLEVKYEDLVANIEFETRRVCEFLGIKFDPAILDPQGFIDYDQFSKFDMQQISSSAYTAWRQRKDAAAFSENVQAWRRSESLFHPPLPDEIANWLIRYGYEVGSEQSGGVNTFQYHQEYSFNTIEPLNISQGVQIHALEEVLQTQVEQSGLVTKDWAARGEHIDQLAQTIGTLTEALHKQAERSELVTKDWAARGEHIDQLAQTIENLTEALHKQVERSELVTKDWAARGEHIDQLAQTIDTLMAALHKQAEHSETITKDWVARGEHIDQLAQNIDTLKGEISDFRSSWCEMLGRTVGKVRRGNFRGKSS